MEWHVQVHVNMHVHSVPFLSFAPSGIFNLLLCHGACVGLRVRHDGNAGLEDSKSAPPQESLHLMQLAGKRASPRSVGQSCSHCSKQYQLNTQFAASLIVALPKSCGRSSRGTSPLQSCGAFIGTASCCIMRRQWGNGG